MAATAPLSVRYGRTAAAVALLTLLALSHPARTEGAAGPFWRQHAGHAAGYAITKVTEPVRAGREATRFEVRAGDCYDTGASRDCDTHRERAELREAWYAPKGRDAWYGFSLLIPADYAEASPKQMLGQWFVKDVGPVMWNRYENGLLTLSPFKVRIPVVKGAWNDLIYNIAWRRRTGRVRVWLNGRAVARLEGVATLPGRFWRGRTGPHFKFGLYRSHVDRHAGPMPTQIVYFDEYRRGVSYGDVDPAGSAID